MKNGLLVYSDKYEYFNIGDYIQSLAAKQFFEKIDVFICRENMHNYADEKVKLILNGWFMHEPENWPPSSSINPLFVSFHINSVAKDKLTNKESILYLKRYSPIGCRDINTVKMLKNYGVEAYFTGCLTLTLGRKYKIKTIDETIYFVDPYFKFCKTMSSLVNYLKILIVNYRVINKLAINMYGTICFKSLLKSSAFYKCYKKIFSDDVLTTAKYVKQELKNSDFDGDKAKFDLAEKLLQQYSSAKYIVTSRIHCALPCLGLGTPVLYVENQQQAETSFCRLNGLRELFHVIKCDNSELSFEKLNGKITSDFSFNNKPEYKVLAEDLIKICTNFADRSL
ncbi:MAG TPA: polysaccharide pyruvyl transferase family protein [Bacteroidetes bacterium]|nr:polysaccharide pyruvyl transferase family protein [Bacteroidota bacterium]